ncbi:MAG: ATP-binding protein, partial [Candidatus Dormibacteria bacterium]
QPNPESPPSEDLRRTYDEAVARRGELQGQLLPLQGRLQQKLKEVGDVALLEERVAALEGEIARLNQAELVVKLAIGELKRAEGLVQNDLAPRLADGLREWLPQLTQNRYRHAWVDPADLQMHVAPRDSGGQIKVDDLSQGTREQIYVLLRTVLAQALSPKGERLPLFFDDPCVSADDTRCQALLDLLRELAHKTQVVVFSHESRVGGWATTAKVPILAMKEVPVSPATAGAAEDKPGESEPVPVLEEV